MDLAGKQTSFSWKYSNKRRTRAAVIIRVQRLLTFLLCVLRLIEGTAYLGVAGLIQVNTVSCVRCILTILKSLGPVSSVEEAGVVPHFNIALPALMSGFGAVLRYRLGEVQHQEISSLLFANSVWCHC